MESQWRSRSIVNEVLLSSRFQALCLIAAVLYFFSQLLHIVYLIYLHPLSNVPGPTLAKVTTWWQGYYQARLQKAGQVQAAHLKYGDVVRIGPNELSFSNPKYLKSIYGHNLHTVKTDFYKGGNFIPGYDNIFSIRNREEHAARRRLMSRNFAQVPLMVLVPDLLRKAESLCHQLEKFSGPVNVYPWLYRLGLEYIFMLSLGQDPRLTETDTHHHALRNLEVFPENFALTAVFPFLKKHGVKVPFPVIREKFEIQAGWEKYCLRVVAEERAKKPADRAAWINRLMDRDDEFLGRPLLDIEIAEEIIGALFAGSGTTSATITFLIYAVISDQHIYQKLKEELNESLAQWPLQSKQMPDISILKQLPYLNAVINEALRRYPSIPGAMPRRIVSDDMKIGEMTLKRDKIISVQNYSVHMHEEYYPDPNRFDPERYLGPDAKKAKDGLNAFSLGPRACLGRNLAILELQIVTALFFRYFDATLDPSMTKQDMEMKIAFSGNPKGEKLLLNLQKVSS